MPGTYPLAVEQLADGIWSWTARHPEWHPGVFGARVVSFALPGSGRTVLIDPLAPDEDGFWTQLDGVVAGPVTVLITIGYHVRSTEAVCDRYPGTTVVVVSSGAFAREEDLPALKAKVKYIKVGKGDQNQQDEIRKIRSNSTEQLWEDYERSIFAREDSLNFRELLAARPPSEKPE